MGSEPGKGLGIDERTGPARQCALFQFERQETGTLPFDDGRIGELGAEAEAAVVIGLPKHENRLPAGLPGTRDPMADELGADIHFPERRIDGERRECKGLVGPVEPAEEDMPDDLTVALGDDRQSLRRTGDEKAEKSISNC